MSLSDQDVKHVARLARLALTPEERENVRRQMEQILDYMKNLEKFDTSQTPPTSHVVPLKNVWREDVAQPFKDTESILSNAPDREENFFKVNKVIE